MTVTNTPRRPPGDGPEPDERGFSLAEVVVALGLLAGVLISVAGLLVLGSRQVGGGRSSSEALAVARDLLEEMNNWNYREVTRRFDDDCDLAVPSCTVDSRSSAAAAGWQSQLELRLTEPWLELELTAIDGTQLQASRALRLRVVVHWREGLRDRNSRLATVRM